MMLTARRMVTEEVNAIIDGMAFAYLTPDIGSVLDLLIELDPPFIPEALQSLSDVEVRRLIEKTVEKWWRDGE